MTTTANHFLRYECRTCKRHGRWYRDGNAAVADGDKHLDRSLNCSGVDVVRRAPGLATNSRFV